MNEDCAVEKMPDVRERLDKLEAILEEGIELGGKVCGQKVQEETEKAIQDDTLAIIEVQIGRITAKAGLVVEQLHNIAQRL